MTESDRELLELAAKAAGYTVSLHSRKDWPFLALTNQDGDYIWNPLTDDGDVFRLAVDLRVDLFLATEAEALTIRDGVRGHAVEAFGDDPRAAARRAIVRAVAETVRGMP